MNNSLALSLANNKEREKRRSTIRLDREIIERLDSQCQIEKDEKEMHKTNLMTTDPIQSYPTLSTHRTSPHLTSPRLASLSITMSSETVYARTHAHPPTHSLTYWHPERWSRRAWRVPRAFSPDSLQPDDDDNDDRVSKCASHAL